MIDLSIIIPAYNEAARIGPTLKAFHRFLSGRDASYEIIVVDDGSTDTTVALVHALRFELAHLTLISSPSNKGKGHAVRTGMLAAKGNIRLFSDADGSTPVAEMEKLLNVLGRGETAIAIGSRYLEDSEIAIAQPKLRVRWSRFVHNIVQRKILPGIADPHCGFKAFIAEAAIAVFAASRIDGWSFDLEILAIAQSLQLGIVEVPVQWMNDARSKARIWQLPKEFYNVWQIRKRLLANR